MKKGLLTLLVFAVTIALSFGFSADTADAKKRGGSFQSNKQSITQKNEASKTDNTQQTTQTKNQTNNTAAASQANKSGGFLKGMLVGGLAGMLFGSMFANMGGFGEILGFIVNMILIVGVIMIIRAAWTYVRNSKKTANNGPNYNRYNNYNQHDEDQENKR